jgi:hypothetical protein
MIRKKQQKQKMVLSDRVILYLASVFGRQTESDKRISFYGTDPFN